MEILTSDDHADTISWLPHGRSFIIYKKKTFAATILPKFFKATKFTSFTRKLNRWGFTRVTRGPEMGSYYHRQFLRDSPELCLRMSSHTSSKYKYRHAPHGQANVLHSPAHHQVQAHLMQTAIAPGGIPIPFYGMAQQQAVMPPGATASNMQPGPATDLSQQNQYINQQLQQLQWQQFQLQQFQQQQLQAAQQAAITANTGGSGANNANVDGSDKTSNGDGPQHQQQPPPTGIGPYPSQHPQQPPSDDTPTDQGGNVQQQPYHIHPPPHSGPHHPHQQHHSGVAPYFAHHSHHQYRQQQQQQQQQQQHPPPLQPHPSSEGGIESVEEHNHTGQQHPPPQTQPNDYQDQYHTQHNPYPHNAQQDQDQHPTDVHPSHTHPQHATAQQQPGVPSESSQPAPTPTPTPTADTGELAEQDSSEFTEDIAA
ncbi:MAG: hypothetical protein ACI90V_001772 [Bacillariaceae sp.]|jgi:hypothetical protein